MPARLVLVLAIATVVASTSSAARASAAQVPVSPGQVNVAGLWHLVPLDADETAIPQHRLDIRLYPAPAPFRAAIVNRQTNADIPYAAASFDGRTLRLRDVPDDPLSSLDIQWLELEWKGTRFEGGFRDRNNQPVARTQALKLVRATSSSSR